MSKVARTNLFLSQLIELKHLSSVSGRKSRFFTLYSASTLIVEQALLALIDELSEPAMNEQVPSTVEALIRMNPDSMSTTARQISLACQQVGHWLYEWFHVRKNIQAMADRPLTNPDDVHLIGSARVDGQDELGIWINGLSELLQECRDQGNYY